MTHAPLRLLRRIAPALLALGLLTACGTVPANSGSAPAPQRPAAVVDDTPADTLDDTSGDTTGSDDLGDTTADDTTDQTALIVDITWAQTSDTDKAGLCADLAKYGPEWAAEKMRNGGGDQSGIDWYQAALLVQAKCAAR